ncbi:unnamed protein product [Prorocentrum cordatum]|uniref:Uncharacterized protein n=1 Tax=Prorocentrum cordatum TaxID=2364126 RepID=A0ABN9W7L0_9DINO|nr:unnamed protein product [Polarella glacialis]
MPPRAEHTAPSNPTIARRQPYRHMFLLRGFQRPSSGQKTAAFSTTEASRASQKARNLPGASFHCGWPDGRRVRVRPGPPPRERRAGGRPRAPHEGRQLVPAVARHVEEQQALGRHHVFDRPVVPGVELAAPRHASDHRL